MTNSKSTKRALLLSALSILMCVAMLVGTTFAWFTDTASTAVNKIQAGTLDIVLEMADGFNDDGSTKWVDAKDKTLKFVSANGNENILWEPGCTYTLPALRLRNNGNLALKYKILVTGIDGDAKLLEAIDWTITYPLPAAATASLTENNSNEGYLLPDEVSATPITISGHMREDAGNEYQGKSIEGIGITVLATQFTYEYDSNDNRYDEDAPLPEPVNGQADLSEKLNTTDSLVNLFLTPGTYTLPAVTNKQVIISGDENTVIDMATSGMTSAGNAGLDITFDGVTVKFNNTEVYKGIKHSSKVSYKDCTIYGKQFMYASDVEFVNCTFINPDDYSVWTYGANNATFENCTFVSGGKALLIYTESSTHTNNVTVNNCTFNDNGYLDTAKAAIEIGDSQPVAGLTVNLVATNNKIYGFANNNEGTATGNKMWGNKNSIPADRLIVTASNNTEYDATVAVTDNATIVAKALKAPTETISVTLTDDVSVNIDLLDPQIAGSGEYRLGGTNTNEINIDLNGHKLTLDTNYMSALGANNFDAVINVKNGSINSTQSSGPWNTYDLLFANCTWNFKDVTFDKAVAIYTNATTTMNNVIINDSNDVYALWITAGAKSVTLNEVTINCPNGRAIAIKDQYVDSPEKVTLSIKDSTFSSAKKAAVLVTNTAGATINADNVDISNVSADNTNLVWVDNGASYQNISNVTVTGCTAIVEH